SHTSKLRAVAMRLSPGSNRTITSPRLTRSQRHSFFGLIVSATRAPHPLPYLTASSSLDPGGFQARGQNMNCAQCDQISDTRHPERNHVASRPLEHMAYDVGNEPASNRSRHPAHADVVGHVLEWTGSYMIPFAMAGNMSEVNV